MIKKVKLFNKIKRNLNNRQIITNVMAKSRFEYVKDYEIDDTLLRNCWIVVRVDGKCFHRFSKIHDFVKPNDINALNLMNHAAMTVMEEFRDIIMSYGQSDEYSFIFPKDTNFYNRRSAKLLSYMTSLFSSAYVYNWQTWFPEKKLQYPPCFDGRIVQYPSDQNLKDYLSWRQADVHVNNLYNTAFWALVLQGNLTNNQAEAELRGTFSSDKNELLFSKFGINYNDEASMFRKGTVLLRKHIKIPNSSKKRKVIIPLYEDMIKEKFWKEHSELLGKYEPAEYSFNDIETSELPNLVYKQIEKLNISG